MIVGRGFSQITIKDMQTIFLIALYMTVQIPDHIAIAYIIPPILILDYFSKKRKLSICN